MAKTDSVTKAQEMNLEDYQKLIENLRIRLNVLNASIFLLEEKLTVNDLSIINYISRINSELEIIRKMIVSGPVHLNHKN